MEKLPDELLIAIFDCLSVDDDTSDPMTSLADRPSPLLRGNWYSIWALCRVNKRFHRVVKARLYSTYRFSIGHPELFLRTISTSPDFALCVKRIVWGSCRDDFVLQTGLLTSREKMQIAAGLRNLGTTSATRLADRFTDLTSSDNDPYLSTILLFSPLVEELFIDGTNGWACNQTWLQLATANPQYLSKLRKVTIRGYHRIDNILSLLALPSLRTLRVTRVILEIGEQYFERRPQYIEWDKGDELYIPSHDGVSQVEDFHLAGPYLLIRHQLSYTNVLQNLKSFRIEWTSSKSNHRLSAYTALIRFFMHHHERLEQILVWDASRDHVESATNLLNCLGGMNRLRSLTINLINFLPPWQRSSRPTAHLPSVLQVHHLQDVLNFFPKAIEELNICMNGPEYFDGDTSLVGSIKVLLDIATTIRTILPSLQRFATVGWHPLLAMFPCQTKRAALQEAFAKGGVTFASQPQSEVEIRDDIYCLDYVERDWVWVQPASSDTFGWKKGFGRNHLDWVCLYSIWCREEEEEDGWMNITILEESGTPCTRRPADMVMDQYMAEQPIWYWEELRVKRSTTEISPLSIVSPRYRSGCEW